MLGSAAFCRGRSSEGERLLCKQDVVGSNPSASTTSKHQRHIVGVDLQKLVTFIQKKGPVSSFLFLYTDMDLYSRAHHVRWPVSLTNCSILGACSRLFT